MRCLILFRDTLGHLPTAQELRECGFQVSVAVLRDREMEAAHTPLAHAAEPPAVYGTRRGALRSGQMDARDKED